MIYLARDYKNNLIKIGFSDNPKVREKTLRSEIPQFDIIFIAVGGKTIERQLHQKYKEYHVRGEWFQLTDSQIEDIITELPTLYKKNHQEFLSQNAVKLLELFNEENQETYSSMYLANNLFILRENLKEVLDELKRKKLIKYKWKENIEIKLLSFP